MSAETKFKCDVCKIDIECDGFVKKQAFTFKWIGVKDEVLTTKGTSPYRDAPIHLCVICIHAIAMWEKERKRANLPNWDRYFEDKCIEDANDRSERDNDR